MNTQKILSLIAVLMMVVALIGCGTKEDPATTPNEKEEVTEKSDTQMVEKPELGISLELTGEYAKCVVVDMTPEQTEAVLKGAKGGFAITQVFSDKEIILSQVLLVPNELISESNTRSQFPYIFSGNKNSVVATLPMPDTNGPDYEKINTLQSGMINQICTLFLDEDSATVGDNSNAGSTDAVTSENPSVPEIVETDKAIEEGNTEAEHN